MSTETPAQKQARIRQANTNSAAKAITKQENADRAAKTAQLEAAREAREAENTDKLEQSAKRVAALHKSMREFEAHAEEKAGFELKKAAEKRAALEQALVEARELCKAAGENFKAFQEKYAPNYNRTRLYQVLAIADGRTTVEDVRKEEREKKRKQRAAKVSGTKGPVPDKAADGEEVSAKPAKAKKGTKSEPEAIEPVLTASTERPIDDVKAAGAALDDEANGSISPNDEVGPLPADGSIPDFMRRTAGEAPPPAKPATNGHANIDGEAFHIQLDKALHAAIALCNVAENWPDLAVKERNRRDAAVKELRTLTHTLVALATPTQH